MRIGDACLAPPFSVCPLWPTARAVPAAPLQENVVQDLYECYELFPTQFRFYIPQLTNFLLHGKNPSNDALEVFLLDKCER